MVPSDRLQTVLNNCVAAADSTGVHRLKLAGRLNDIDAVKELAEMIPSDRLQTVMADSNGDDAVAAEMVSVRLQTVLNGCVAGSSMR